MNRIIVGDILRFAAHYQGPRFHGVLCDPPYELGFMGKSWDSRGVSFRAETWNAIGSLLAPGAHLLAFGGTRTFHRIAVAIEDAGFEIRDTIGWVYGSGFPKSHDVSKAIDREAGAEGTLGAPKSAAHAEWIKRGRMRGENGHEGYQRPWMGDAEAVEKNARQYVGATDSARAWHGYGTALKPAWEPVIVARWPLAGTVAQNAQEHGAGALNVDGCRVGDEPTITIRSGNSGVHGRFGKDNRVFTRVNPPGRWPANIIHDDSDEIADVFGDAKRFFYSAKASKRERDEGLDGFELRIAGAMDARSERSGVLDDSSGDGISRARNHHPTVKPLALTEYLARLIVPPHHVDSRILVPFAGSGSECIGAIRAGWRHVVGVEQSDEYARIARARIEHHSR